MPSKSTPTKTHEECLQLVCAFCTNLIGVKASRPVKKSELNLIKKHVFAGYLEDSMWFPRGICATCARRLYDLEKQDKEDLDKKKVHLRLPASVMSQYKPGARLVLSAPVGGVGWQDSMAWSFGDGRRG